MAAATNDTDGWFNTGDTAASSPSQRRTMTLSNGQTIWDFSGNAWEITQNQITGSQPGASGYAWREWNAASATNMLPQNKPSYYTGNDYSTAYGIGAVYSNSAETVTKIILHGGAYGEVNNAGPFATYLMWSTTDNGTSVGFRAAR